MTSISSNEDGDDARVTAFFAWGPNKTTSSVSVLISKAQGIYCNDFKEHEGMRKYSSYVLEQFNDGGCFSTIVKLEPGVYHFLFLVVDGENKDFTATSTQTSPFYNRTYVAPGIEVNYIELSPKHHKKPESFINKKRLPKKKEKGDKTQEFSIDSKDTRHSRSTKCVLQ